MRNKFLQMRVFFVLLIVALLLVRQLEAKDNNFEGMLDGLLEGTVPQVTVNALSSELTQEPPLLLDTREEEEFQLSHLKGARWVGFSDFSLERVKDLKKNTPIVTYCSVGKRSEIIGEKLQAAGFTNVRNLRGGIFAWANKDKPVFSRDKKSESIHPYNSKWGKWLK